MEQKNQAERTCKQCGQKLLGRQKRFCSKECSNRWHGSEKKKHRVGCARCGKPVPRPGSKFCSRECYGEWKIGRNSKNELVNECIPTVDGKHVEMECESCGKTFLVEHHRATKTRFCSSRCFGDSRKKAGYEKRQQQNENNLWRQSLMWPQFANAWIKSNPSCAECGKHRRGRNLVVHHVVDPNPTRDESLLFLPSNLLVLCRACHVRLHNPRLGTSGHSASSVETSNSSTPIIHPSGQGSGSA